MSTLVQGSAGWGEGGYHAAEMTLLRDTGPEQGRNTGFAGGSDAKEPACQCRRRGLHPWVMKIPWRRKWQPAPVFLPGEFYGRRSLSGGYNLWGQKELDTIERPGSHARKKSSAVAVAVRG